MKALSYFQIRCVIPQLVFHHSGRNMKYHSMYLHAQSHQRETQVLNRIPTCRIWYVCLQTCYNVFMSLILYAWRLLSHWVHWNMIAEYDTFSHNWTILSSRALILKLYRKRVCNKHAEPPQRDVSSSLWTPLQTIQSHLPSTRYLHELVRA